MRRVLGARLDEFVVAAITAVAVVVLGVEQGIILAIVLSVIDHLRVGYHPNDTYIVPTPSGGSRSVPVTPTGPPQEAAPGLVVYRFGANLYYANANRFIGEIRRIVENDPHLERICIDLGGVGDIDYTGGEALRGLFGELEQHDVSLVLAAVSPLVGARLTRYGLLDTIGEQAVFDTVQDVVDHHSRRNTES
jgi:MFS superfamily sulfate permease-like transporter